MVTWNEVFTELMKDPDFKREYDALEDWYQAELAKQEALDRAETSSSASPKPYHPAHLNPSLV